MLASSAAFLLLIIVSQDTVLEKLLQVVTSILFSSILPVAFIYTQRQWINTDEGSERFLPLVVGIVSYGTGFLALRLMDAPVIVLALMFCYATNTLLVLGITQLWKVSVHSTAITGPLVALSYKFGIVVVPFYLLILLVGISRLVLQKHTVAQVIVGVLIGMIGTGAQMYYIFKLPFPF
ncbi:phosphoesterase PA-phosphatase [Fischerella thermalis CCMEE 5201]|jgi:membrane-associated phospholipid phosphatase|nr:phosphoesterase PA-phosphatase [Fischerella thermalis CCMEE 5201]